MQNQVKYEWKTGRWGECSKSCLGGIKNRIVRCLRAESETVDDAYCKASSRPTNETICNEFRCPQWIFGNYSPVISIANWGWCQGLFLKFIPTLFFITLFSAIKSVNKFDKSLVMIIVVRKLIHVHSMRNQIMSWHAVISGGERNGNQ